MHAASSRYYGGWLADNIYYLGKTGVVSVGGLRIGGISGIFKAAFYRRGYTESFPLNENDMRSIYYVREFETLKLSLLEQPIDIMMSHDWPGVSVDHGDVDELLRRKPHFEEDVCTSLPA